MAFIMKIQPSSDWYLILQTGFASVLWFFYTMNCMAFFCPQQVFTILGLVLLYHGRFRSRSVPWLTVSSVQVPIWGKDIFICILYVNLPWVCMSLCGIHMISLYVVLFLFYTFLDTLSVSLLLVVRTRMFLRHILW